MKTEKIALALLIVVSMLACHATKKSVTSTAATTPPPATAASPASTTSNNLMLLKPADGIYAPGDAELLAIQTKFKEVTLTKLSQGYEIYTKGACVGCHGAVNIYQIDEYNWPGIINDMALRASISDEQKDAVNKYVLAIKAARAK
jgi:hypothetical protein